MRRFISLGVLPLALALAVGSGDAHGSTVHVDVYAEMLWESLRFEFTPLEGESYGEGDDFLRWLPYEAYSGVSTRAGHTDGDTISEDSDGINEDLADRHNGWYAGSVVSSALGARSAAGSLEGPGGGPYALAIIDIAGPNIHEYASAWAARGGQFEALASGTMTVSIDYVMLANVFVTGGGHGSYNAFVGPTFANIDGVVDWLDSTTIWLDTSGSRSGTWTSAPIQFYAGDSGFVEAVAWVEAEGITPIVPEPASLFLMSVGLGVLMASRRLRAN